ncbi:hypothetical protein SOM61_26385 [Massilia sp. CFBP9012]|uniref:hypothetical protein n=1 Tax=Massilia sp. CFBP9012 TaxID=3096531 RepID=UPI002A6992A5|nr:hypothetical protein [Massilia sp. CFBP9012]MDY0978494.1 hypothetical protein [Massilia sp. CFBP9012]
MVADVTFFEGPLKFQLQFAEVDPTDLGVQAWLEVEYAGWSQCLKWTAEHFGSSMTLSFDLKMNSATPATPNCRK